MKWPIYILLVLGLVSLSYSCRSAKFIPVTETIDLSEYQVYVFRLCEYRKSYGNTRYFLCDKPCENSDIQANPDTQIIEELYVLHSKANPEKVIYLTSKSDKYIRRNRGIFNDSLYKNYIMASDIEYVYFGKMKQSGSLNFVNPTEDLSFYFRQDAENCRFVIDSIYSQTVIKNSISNKHLKIFDLFNVEIQFLESDREIIISKKERDTVQSMVLRDGRMYFNGKAKRVNLSQRSRLKYHPVYGPKQDSLVRKVIIDSLQKKEFIKTKDSKRRKS